MIRIKTLTGKARGAVLVSSLVSLGQGPAVSVQNNVWSALGAQDGTYVRGRARNLGSSFCGARPESERRKPA